MSTDKVLTFAEIDAADDLEVTFVEVPRWGGKVGIRIMTAHDRTELERITSGPKTDPLKFRKRLLLMTLCNKDRSPLLVSEAQADQLMRKSAAEVEKLVDEALRHNGIGKRDVEELEKN